MLYFEIFVQFDKSSKAWRWDYPQYFSINFVKMTLLMPVGPRVSGCLGPEKVPDNREKNPTP